MSKFERFLGKLIVIFCIAAIGFASTDIAFAAKSNRNTQSESTSSSAKGGGLPWNGIPWVIAGALSVGAIAVAAKNAKRSNLD